MSLISYTHLNFLLKFYKNENLKPLWETGLQLQQKYNPSFYQNSENYWNEIDNNIITILNKNYEQLKYFKILELEKTKEIGYEGIIYWQNKIKEYESLSKEQAVRLLINAEKIEAKIKTIQKYIDISIEL